MGSPLNIPCILVHHNFWAWRVTGLIEASRPLLEKEATRRSGLQTYIEAVALPRPFLDLSFYPIIHLSSCSPNFPCVLSPLSPPPSSPVLQLPTVLNELLRSGHPSVSSSTYHHNQTATHIIMSRITSPQALAKLTRSISTTAPVARPTHLLNNGCKAASAAGRKRQSKSMAKADEVVKPDAAEVSLHLFSGCFPIWAIYTTVP